jgi:hypothetical protein
MRAHLLTAVSSGPAGLNQPGTYLHWSIFDISVANLIVIAVMVVLFGAALLLPFPRGERADPAGARPEPGLPDEPAPEADRAVSGDERMWTARARRLALRLLPPGKLLPDRQPAYVASWVYVFGVATLAALALGLRDIPRWIPVHRLIWRATGQPADTPADGQRDRQPSEGGSGERPARTS